MDSALAAVAGQPLDRPNLDFVAERRRGSVRIDIIDVARRNPGALDRRRHGPVGAIAALLGRGDVIGVPRHAVTDEFGINSGAARLGVFVGFEDDAAGALAHDEPVAVLIVGPRGLFWPVVEIRG